MPQNQPSVSSSDSNKHGSLINIREKESSTIFSPLNTGALKPSGLGTAPWKRITIGAPFLILTNKSKNLFLTFKL